MSDLLCRKLQLNHVEGDALYPMRMKDRETREIAFRVSKGDNTKQDSIPVTDEEEMIRKVTTQGYKVRARTEAHTSHGGRTGLYSLTHRAIRSWQLLETQENQA
jgi:hypothetical protein